MTFSEFAQILHDFIGVDRKQWEFPGYLLSLFMHEPRTDEDIQLDEQDKYYPYSTIKQKSAAAKVYAGDDNRNLPVKVARFVLGHQRKTALIDAIYDLDDDPKDQLCMKLTNLGIVCDYNTIADVAADVLCKILEARVRGEDGYIPPTQGSIESQQGPLANETLKEIHVKDGVLYLKGATIKLPVQLTASAKIEPHEHRYVNALCEAYADALERSAVCPDDIPTLPKKFSVSFSSQRKAYYAAESVRRSVRDVIDDGDHQFELLEDEAYVGIEETYWSDYKNGFERLNAVLGKITSVALNKSALLHITNLIGTLEKKGICHILVNNEKIDSWVHTDG